MLKKVVAFVLVALLCIGQVCSAGKMVDSHGWTIDGKLEEYDREAKNASSTGFNKSGFYIEPQYRYELQQGFDEEEWEKVDAGQPRHNFSKSSTQTKTEYKPYEPSPVNIDNRYKYETPYQRSVRLTREQADGTTTLFKYFFFSMMVLGVFGIFCSAYVELDRASKKQLPDRTTKRKIRNPYIRTRY